MSGNRITRKVLDWDINLSKYVSFKTWTKELEVIFSEAGLYDLYSSYSSFPIKPVVETIRNKLVLQQQEYLMSNCQNYSKLKTYVTFKDFSSLPCYLSLPLSFTDKKNICKAIL